MLHWLKENWLKILIVIFCVFLAYWIIVRPVEVRKKCSLTKRHSDAVPAKDASPNWPTCQDKGVNIFDSVINGTFSNPVNNCYGPKPAQASRDWESAATQQEYTQCLRENGLN